MPDYNLTQENVKIVSVVQRMPEVAGVHQVDHDGGKAKNPPNYEPNPMAKRETMEFVRAYYKIKDANVRKRLRAMAKALAAATSKDS